MGSPEKHGIRKIPEEEAKECVNTLILFVRQNPEFVKFEGSLLALEDEMGGEGRGSQREGRAAGIV